MTQKDSISVKAFCLSIFISFSQAIVFKEAKSMLYMAVIFNFWEEAQNVVKIVDKKTAL
jgi:hypothetical protein